MIALLREIWAWSLAGLAVAGGWLADINHWLALLGIIVASLTAWERWLLIRVRRRQLAENGTNDG